MNSSSLKEPEIYIENKQYQLARKDLNQAIKINYKSIEAKYVLLWLEGLLEKENENYNTAIDKFEKMKGVEPEFAKPYFEIALVYKLKGESSKACTELKKGKKLRGPKNRSEFIEKLNLKCE